MYENIADWLLARRLNWYHLQKMVKEVRGVVQDRKGKRYWLYIREYGPGHFRISLYPWPGLTYSSANTSAGWIGVGVTQSQTSWMIYDVHVDLPQYKRRGIATALVKTAIALAGRRGAQELRGMITTGDAREYPFLPTWYARFGFTVQFCDEGEPAPGGVRMHATFRMDLPP